MNRLDNHVVEVKPSWFFTKFSYIRDQTVTSPQPLGAISSSYQGTQELRRYDCFFHHFHVIRTVVKKGPLNLGCSRKDFCPTILKNFLPYVHNQPFRCLYTLSIVTIKAPGFPQILEIIIPHIPMNRRQPNLLALITLIHFILYFLLCFSQQHYHRITHKHIHLYLCKIYMPPHENIYSVKSETLVFL